MDVTVGQEVGIQSGRRGDVYFGYKVARVTPSGQIVVCAEGAIPQRRFDKRGHEMGVSLTYGSDRLVTDVAGARATMARRARMRTACAAIGKVRAEDGIDPCWQISSLRGEVERLERLVREARAAVEAVDPAEAEAIPAGESAAEAPRYDDPEFYASVAGEDGCTCDASCAIHD